MPDNASRLLQRLLDLTEGQGRCLAKQDWEGFANLAETCQVVLSELTPLVAGRQDLVPALMRLAQLDEAHTQQLAAAHQALQHEVDVMPPQQAAVMAYYQGEYQPANNAARFIDQRD